MPPRRFCHLPVAGKTFLDDPELVLIRPLPTANAIGGRENFDLSAVNEIGHKVERIIGSQPKSDGLRRSPTMPVAHGATSIPIEDGYTLTRESSVKLFCLQNRAIHEEQIWWSYGAAPDQSEVGGKWPKTTAPSVAFEVNRARFNTMKMAE